MDFAQNQLDSLKEPIWLLIGAFLVLVAGLIYFWPKTWRSQLNINHPNATAIINRQAVIKGFARPLVVVGLLGSILAGAYLASRPVTAIEQRESQSLVSWVIDVSESMNNVDISGVDDQPLSRFQGAVEAVRMSVDSVPERSMMQLVTFSNASEVQAGPMTYSKDSLRKQLDSLEPPSEGAATETSFGLAAAVDACVIVMGYDLDSGNDGNLPCTVILLSDGECTPQPFCQKDVEDVAKRGRDQGVVINTVSWGDPLGDPTEIELPNPAAMERLANIGQGQHLETGELSQLVKLYQEIVSRIEVEEIETVAWGPAVLGARILMILMALLVWREGRQKNQGLVINQAWR